MGDFNAVKGAHERSSDCLPNTVAYQDFCDFIDATGFIEAPTVGLRYIWSGRLFMPSHVESRLDRALFSADFASHWHSIHSQALCHLTSDHSPLVLACSLPPSARRCFFRFLNMWILHLEFQEMVQSSWDSELSITCPIFWVMSKLKRLRNRLKIWNKSTLGNMDMMIMETHQELLDIQNLISSDGYTDDLFDKEVLAQAKINIALSRKSELLRQKSRVSWLQDGDRNTAFFHTLLRCKKKPLIISHLEINGSMVYDSAIIGQHIVDYFTQLFTGSQTSQLGIAAIEVILDHLVSDQHNAMLSRIPDDDEIITAVFQIDPYSSPGPDGFTSKYFQSCWSIKHDIWRAVRTFFERSYLLAGHNANTLILISKKEVVSTVADLRPIVMSNFLFKIISKVLATRLNIIAACYVSPNQFDFISGKSIHDCIMLGFEGVN
ncbi:uncharacterized protein LOC130990559 [Salvia miltiorrhiza]|uniref:uncharacterized protein LOC130990559 n=1 Tax=Salvia miltiorrhiza TaxID=226208 RepID=UPI0025AB6399|nr:uncharacterized protein LOC130990559 [Salvia miltiorrhiza]